MTELLRKSFAVWEKCDFDAVYKQGKVNLAHEKLPYGRTDVES